MKRLFNFEKGIFLLFFIATSTLGFAQKTLILDAKPQLKISGTSSLHDWDMVSEIATGKLTGTVEGNKLTTITSLVVEMPAESIKSGKGGMDKNAYKALKTNQYKTVKFDLKAASKHTDGTWNFSGTFTISGVSKSVTIKIKESIIGGQTVFEGSYSFKLTDYKITPPTALMGTVKTGDDVKISFTLKFK
ncbi:YceI family protein [Flavobacterium piscinae]|uniref:YceI family protein n=1 Tax=Flavobacterium piscinae TaxID=2506424 RepID=A0A4Q1KJS7_9FLAO|nr:YceI family protein [Flavobacterium piscinae]MBC8883442.1 YceI family protein [Flavobacterium piscinae]RXR29645.1 YceI family protein [Flavobacterium piscinae]